MLSEEYNVELSFLSTTEPNMFMNVFHVKKNVKYVNFSMHCPLTSYNISEFIDSEFK